MSDFVTRSIVDGALALLAILSALTWILILNKAYVYCRSAMENRRFTGIIQSREPGSPVFALRPLQDAAKGMKARVTRTAAEALSHVTVDESGRPVELATYDRQELLERSLGRQIRRERRALEHGLTLLATIANVAPFVGLFGTVFGIIHALNSIAAGSTSGIAGVAGPVGQALVATGIGIAVAIPAVLAYNLFLRRLRLTIVDLEEYADDLIDLAQRNGFSMGGGEAVFASVASALAHMREVQT